MRSLTLMLCLAAMSGPLYADMWKCETPGESILFTSDRNEAKAKNCKQITVTPNIVTSPPPPAGKAAAPRNSDAPSPDGFPKVAPQVQQQRDNDRRKILETDRKSVV